MFNQLIDGKINGVDKRSYFGRKLCPTTGSREHGSAGKWTVSVHHAETLRIQERAGARSMSPRFSRWFPARQTKFRKLIGGELRNKMGSITDVFDLLKHPPVPGQRMLAEKLYFKFGYGHIDGTAGSTPRSAGKGQVRNELAVKIINCRKC